MNGKSVYTLVPPSPGIRSVQDEWGMFDPNQAGLKAAFRAARALNHPEDDLAESVETDELAPAPSVVQPAAREVVAPAPVAAMVSVATAEPAIAERVIQPAVPERKPVLVEATVPLAAPAAVKDENLDDLLDPPAPRRAASVDRGAVYTLEFPTKCPQCSSEIGTVRVSRLLRTQVSFTSTLPRKGYIIVCPHCEGILSAELSGLI